MDTDHHPHQLHHLHSPHHSNSDFDFDFDSDWEDEECELEELRENNNFMIICTEMNDHLIELFDTKNDVLVRVFVPAEFSMVSIKDDHNNINIKGPYEIFKSKEFITISFEDITSGKIIKQVIEPTYFHKIPDIQTLTFIWQQKNEKQYNINVLFNDYRFELFSSILFTSETKLNQFYSVTDLSSSKIGYVAPLLGNNLHLNFKKEKYPHIKIRTRTKFRLSQLYIPDVMILIDFQDIWDGFTSLDPVQKYKPVKNILIQCYGHIYLYVSTHTIYAFESSDPILSLVSYGTRTKMNQHENEFVSIAVSSSTMFFLHSKEKSKIVFPTWRRLNYSYYYKYLKIISKNSEHPVLTKLRTWNIDRDQDNRNHNNYFQEWVGTGQQLSRDYFKHLI